MLDQDTNVGTTGPLPAIDCPAASLAVSVTHCGGTAVILFRGDLDLAMHDRLSQTLTDMVRLKPVLVVVDLSQVGLFDCGAIGEFLRARSALRAAGSTLVLRAPSAAGLRMLEVVGLLDLVSVASMRDVGSAASPRETVPFSTEVAVLSHAWRTACETHPTMSAPVVFAEPELVISDLLAALESGSLRPPAAGDPLPTTVGQDGPVARLAVAQLLALQRTAQSWVRWSAPPSRQQELQRRVAEWTDAIVVEIVSAALSELETVALLDPLTGLLNRRALDRDLKQFLAAARRHDRPLTVVMLDVVGLKSTNDRFGHEAGDDMLQDVATGLVNTLRVGDNVYRIGGDEFVLLLPDLRPEDVDAVMDRTVVSSGGAFTWGSAGVPTDPDTVAETPASLLKLADHRMIEHRARTKDRGDRKSRSRQGSPVKSRLAGDSARLVGELRAAEHNHLVVEQAKGIIAEHFAIGVDEAFAMLSSVADNRERPVRRIARGLVDRTIDPAELASRRPVHGRSDSDEASSVAPADGGSA